MVKQAQRRAETRERLLDAAAEVFAQLGFYTATVDDVAVAAGNTKGAVYAHFGKKEELFLALLDRHLDAQFAAIETLFDIDDAEDLRIALERETKHALENTAFGLLTIEFWLYAMRQPSTRAKLASRYAEIRETLAGRILQRYAKYGVEPPHPPDDLASLVLALDAGLFMQQLADPGAIGPQLRADAVTALIDPEV